MKDFGFISKGSILAEIKKNLDEMPMKFDGTQRPDPSIEKTIADKDSPLSDNPALDIDVDDNDIPDTFEELLASERYKQVVDKLPETHGIYYFKNQQKEIIYVGKANNIKQRVISHFYDKKKKERTMCLETADITFKETGSELIALLHESSEIKKHYPKFNRAQRKSGEAVAMFSYVDQKGIVHLAYNRLKLISKPLMKFYSVAECRNVLEKVCSEFDLCPKYCHLQTNVNSCFHYQLKQCKGVCSGKESPNDYNKRVHDAINSLGLQTENLVIKEKGRNTKEIGFVLILNGIYQGFGYVDKKIKLEDTNDYQLYLQPQQDNRDVQRIIKSYLTKK